MTRTGAGSFSPLFFFSAGIRQSSRPGSSVRFSSFLLFPVRVYLGAAGYVSWTVSGRAGRYSGQFGQYFGQFQAVPAFRFGAFAYIGPGPARNRLCFYLGPLQIIQRPGKVRRRSVDPPLVPFADIPGKASAGISFASAHNALRLRWVPGCY